MTVSLVDRVGFEVDAIDVFCGFGGSSQGIHAAGATLRAAANHSALSLECHAANFPEVDHWQADFADPIEPMVRDLKGKLVSGTYMDPADLPRARFAWFSPSCTHHSQANATKVYERGLQMAMLDDEEWDEQRYVNSERSRVTMSCVLRYVGERKPEVVAVENVIEVTRWGRGKPGDGSTFRWWYKELEKLGYTIQLCWLNSMFFAPCPQSRDRLYIVAHRKGNKAPDLDYRPTAYCTSDLCAGRLVSAVQTWKPRTKAWVTDTWGKYLAQYDYRCPECRAQVHPASWMALSAIDWSDLGPTLGERDKPVAAKTFERIRRAVQKYLYAPPLVLPPELVNATQVHVAHAEAVKVDNTGSEDRYHGNRARHAGEQLPTLAQRNSIGVAAATMPLRSGRARSGAVADPLPTLVADGGRLALALAVKHHGSMEEAKYRGHHIADPLGTITEHPAQSVLALVLPNRTNNQAAHAGAQTPSVMTSATVGIVSAAGNTHERPGQTRARHVAEPLFTQSATAEFGMAALPVLRGDHEQSGHASEPVDTVSARGNHHAVVTALFQKINGGPEDTAPHSVGEPFLTITAGGKKGIDPTGLIVVPWVDQWLSDPVGVTEQLATITSRLRHSLATLEPCNEPITDEQLMSVRFRMLQPDPELRRAMAFADDYKLLGNKGQMTAGLGNAVTPPVASWITARCLATLGG